MIEIAKTSISYALDAYKHYFGKGCFQYLYLLALVLILVFGLREHLSHNDPNIRVPKASPMPSVNNKSCHLPLLLTYPTLVLLIIFFPPVIYVVVRITEGYIYWRMFWIILLPLVIAFSFTLVTQKIYSRFMKYICVILCIVAIVFSGRFIFQKGNYSEPENWYHLPEDVIQVCQILSPEKEKIERVVVPDTLLSYIRQFDPGIKMPYGRDGGQYSYINSNADPYKEQRALRSQLLNPDMLDMIGIRDNMLFLDCNYLVIPANVPVSEDPLTCGFEYIGETSSYLIYMLNG